jgi:hypothetical protein
VDDPLTLYKAMRPEAPAPTDDIQVPTPRQVRTPGGAVDLHDLAMVPGSPAYRARIPRPPCAFCGEDHFPGRSYDHEWRDAVHDEPVAATAVMRRPPSAEVPPTPQSSLRRVALYVGRGETYVVSVEEPPDWDTVESFRLLPAQVLPLITLARALGVKVADKTGGDLLMMEQDAEDARQYAQANGRGAPAAGSDGPRQRRIGAGWEKASESRGDEPEDRAVPGTGG